MTEEKPLLDRVLELAVFGPLGLATSVREQLPTWAERGRHELANRVMVARTVGQFAVAQGPRRAQSLLRQLRSQSEPLLGRLGWGVATEVGGRGVAPAGTGGSGVPDLGGGATGNGDPGGTPGPGADGPGADDLGGDDLGGEDLGGQDLGGQDLGGQDLGGQDLGGWHPGGGVPGAEAIGLDAGKLPIPAYDTLSAMQVVQRLPGLSVDELDAVRAYELAGRARKTVLLKVAQLRDAS